MNTNNQQSAISNQQSAISNQQSAISNQQSAISNQQSILKTMNLESKLFSQRIKKSFKRISVKDFYKELELW